MASPEPILEFYAQVARLKNLKRAGWRRCGVEPCESVAEHTFGVSALALALTKSAGVNRDKCLALAVVHDLAEAIVGDITPNDGIDPAEKSRRESEAIARFAQTLGDESLVALWKEFESAATPEAKLVRDLDVIEMALQAREYQRLGRLSASDADEFVQSARRRVTTEIGKRLIEAASGQT